MMPMNLLCYKNQLGLASNVAWLKGMMRAVHTARRRTLN